MPVWVDQGRVPTNGVGEGAAAPLGTVCVADLIGDLPRSLLVGLRGAGRTAPLALHTVGQLTQAFGQAASAQSAIGLLVFRGDVASLLAVMQARATNQRSSVVLSGDQW